MKKFCGLTVFLALCGCLEQEKAPAKAGAAAAGGLSATPAIDASPVGLGLAPKQPLVDARIRLAELVRDAAVGREEALREQLARVRDAVLRLKLDDKDRRLATGAALKAALPEVVRIAESAIEDTRKAADALAEYRREVHHAETALKTAAQAWRDRARDYPTGGDHSELNLEFAASYESMAKRCPPLLERVDAFARRLPEVEAFLKDHKQFLADFDLYLRAAIDLEGEDPVRKFLARRKPRHQAIDEYHGLLLLFLEVIRTQALSPKIQGEVRRERAAREQAERLAREQAEQAAREATERLAERTAPPAPERPEEAGIRRASKLAEEFAAEHARYRDGKEHVRAWFACFPAGTRQQHLVRFEKEWLPRLARYPVHRLQVDNAATARAPWRPAAGAYLPFFCEDTERFAGVAVTGFDRSGAVLSAAQGAFPARAYAVGESRP